MAGGDSDPRVTALAKEVERWAQHTRRNDRLLQALSTQVAELLEGAQQEAEHPEPGEVRSWLLGDDPELADADLADLITWLDAVYLRYPGAELPVCWLWHPAIIEELWWLRCAHHDAYLGPGASYTRVADWHDRQRPGVVGRLQKWQRGCDLPQHQNATAQQGTPLPGSASRVAQSWASARDIPQPTTEELAEAATYEDQRNRRKTR